ncbi:MAG: hypothetical protein IJ057_13370 [Bacteroidales bacterium]|nr:hypothetical protein [Bacteroidales bacterium]
MDKQKTTPAASGAPLEGGKAAGETATGRDTSHVSANNTTKWGWGLVAVVGLFVATTIEGSLIITAAGTAFFGLGAYLGGYMQETTTGKGGAL